MVDKIRVIICIVDQWNFCLNPAAQLSLFSNSQPFSTTSNTSTILYSTKVRFDEGPLHTFSEYSNI